MLIPVFHLPDTLDLATNNASIKGSNGVSADVNIADLVETFASTVVDGGIEVRVMMNI